MPHSVSPPTGSPGRGDDDELLPDALAPTENGGVAVQLQDLFNDDDNEEFPASSAADTKMESPAPEPAE